MPSLLIREKLRVVKFLFMNCLYKFGRDRAGRVVWLYPVQELGDIARPLPLGGPVPIIQNNMGCCNIDCLLPEASLPPVPAPVATPAPAATLSDLPMPGARMADAPGVAEPASTLTAPDPEIDIVIGAPQDILPVAQLGQSHACSSSLVYLSKDHYFAT